MSPSHFWEHDLDHLNSLFIKNFQKTTKNLKNTLLAPSQDIFGINLPIKKYSCLPSNASETNTVVPSLTSALADDLSFVPVSSTKCLAESMPQVPCPSNLNSPLLAPYLEPLAPPATSIIIDTPLPAISPPPDSSTFSVLDPLNFTSFDISAISKAPPGLYSMHLNVHLDTLNGLNCSVLAYVDCGAAGGNFISRSFVNLNAIPTVTTSASLVSGFTGSSSTSTSAVTAPLKLSVGSHHTETINFTVLDECRHPLILGYDWLFLHNPVVDWKAPSVTFSRCYCNGLPSSIPVLGEPLSLVPPPSPLAKRSPLPVPIAALPSEEYIDDSDYEDDADDAELISSLLPPAYSVFADVFSEKAANLLPQHRPFDCSIDLDSSNPCPPYRPIYSLSPKESKSLDDYLDDNLAKGFIRPSKSPAGAPIFFVKKKSGELRPCVDYTALNAMTVKNRGPLPLINDLLDRLRSAKFFLKLDLRGAYNLVRIKPGDEWKTAFRCHRGHFEYLVMPFGLTNAPAIFQSMMNTLFSDILDVFVIIYLDDILVFSNSLESHRSHVATVLSRLRENNLYAKLSKCSFDQDSVEFLGHTVSSFGISPLPEKVFLSPLGRPRLT